MIEKTNVTREVLSYLRENIENGTWQPGSRIPSENSLTEILQVSRSSVRFAIQQLIAVGALESFHGKGTFVTRQLIGEVRERLNYLCADTEIEQLLEFRKIVETESSYLAATRISPAQIERLKQCFENMRRAKSHSAEFIRNDIEFHKVILQATGNRLVVQSMDIVMDEIEKQQVQLNTDTGVRNAIFFHEQILNAILRHDPRAARAAMNRHLSSGLKNIRI